MRINYRAFRYRHSYPFLRPMRVLPLYLFSFLPFARARSFAYTYGAALLL